MRYTAVSLLFFALLSDEVLLAAGPETALNKVPAGYQQAVADSNSLEQQPISIRGNRALPKTLFITPWKQLGAPLDSDPLGAPTEQLAPLERDLFLRELEVYHDGFPAEDSWQ